MLANRTHLNLVSQVKAASLLKGVALQVYEIICNKPGLTVGEMAIEYAGTGQDPTALGRSRNELAKRVSDLVNFGAIKSDGKTLCPYTNRQVNRYVPTGSLPERNRPVSEVVPLLAAPVTRTVGFKMSMTSFSILYALRQKAYSLQFTWWLPKTLKVKASHVVKALDEVLYGTGDQNG